MNSTLRLLTLCVALALCCVTKADNIRTISAKEGLSNSAVQAFGQDVDGYLWIGTCDGMNIWNGKDMQSNFRGLCGNLIEDIVQTSDNYFWVRSNYGLDLLNPQTGEVKNFPQFDGKFKIAASSRNQAVVLTAEDYMYLYDDSSASFVNIKKPVEFNTDKTLLLKMTEQGTILVITPEKILVYKVTKKNGISTMELMIERPLYAKLKYAFYNGGYFAIGEDLVLCEWDTEKREIKRIADISKYTGSSEISDVLKDDNDYYVGLLTGGCLRVSPNSKGVYQVETVPIGYGVMSLFKGSENDFVWIGTDGGGVCEIIKEPVTIKSYISFRLPIGDVKPIRAIYKDKEGCLWIGTKGAGLLQVHDFGTGKEKIRQFSSKNSVLLDDAVYALSPGSRNLFWIGSDGHGLNYYSFTDHALHTLKVPGSMRYVHSIIELDSETLWVACVGEGVFKITLEKGRIPAVKAVEKLYINEEMVTSNYFFSMHKRDRTLWFGNRGEGAVKYSLEDGNMEVVRFDNLGNTIANDIFAILGVGNNMYFGTSAGLIKMTDRDTMLVEGITGTVHALLSDNGGNVWASTNKGIVRYTPETGTTATYNYSRGLKVTEFSDGAFYSDESEGTMYFGGVNGLVSISGDGMLERSNLYPIVFSTLTVNGEIRKVRNMMDKSGTVVLQDTDRLTSISLIAVDFEDADDLSYYIRMRGVNDNWTEVPRTITIPDLSPGRYTLEARYNNKATGEGSPIYYLAIRQKPAWYESNFFKVIYLLVLLGLFVFIYIVFRNRQRRKREEAERNMRELRRQEIYDSNKRLYDKFTRDLTEPLTIISASCQELLNRDIPDAGDQALLRSAVRNSGKLQNMVYVLHEMKNLDNDKAETKLEELALNPVSEIALAAVSQYEDAFKEILFKDKIDREVLWPIDKSDLNTILDTLLRNSVRHTPKGGEIELKIEVKDEVLEMSCTNTRAADDTAPFSNTDPSTAMCYNIILHIGGTMAMVPPGEKDEFAIKVRIPKTIGVEVGTVSVDDPSKKTIFVVNEKGEVLSFMGEIFGKEYNVRLLPDINALREALSSNLPDALICCSLAKTSIWRQAIKVLGEGKMSSHIPVILITTIQQLNGGMKEFQSEADLCIAAPFNVDYLKSEVRRTLEKRASLKDFYASPESSYEISKGKVIHKEDKEFLNSVMKVIMDNVSNGELSTEFVASALGMTVRTLYRRMADITTDTPAALIREYRLTLSEKLLRTTKMTVDEIVYRSGYTNRGAFFKNFKERYKKTPQEYRKGLNTNLS